MEEVSSSEEPYSLIREFEDNIVLGMNGNPVDTKRRTKGKR